VVASAYDPIFVQLPRPRDHVQARRRGDVRVGARLDHAPALLFTLRKVSADELHDAALTGLPTSPSPSRVLAADSLGSLFGIELADAAAVDDRGTHEQKAAQPRSVVRSAAASHTGPDALFATTEAEQVDVARRAVRLVVPHREKGRALKDEAARVPRSREPVQERSFA